MPRFAEVLALRLRQIRVECYGEQGIPDLCEALGIPAGTWENFEAGVAISAVVLLQFLERTGCDRRWLLKGDGAPVLAFRHPYVIASAVTG
jgi:hypothetical protein